MKTQVLNLNFNNMTQACMTPDTSALDGMMNQACFLTPDSLMSYCATRLRGLDTQVQTAFAQQQSANADSEVLTSLSEKLPVPSKPLDMGGGVDKDLGMTPKEYAEAEANALSNAARDANDPTVKAALNQAHDDLVAKINAGGTIDVDDFKSVTSGAVSKIQQDLNSGAELSMINLQSLMSQRQQAVQVCTNLVQSLGDQCNKIAENVGH